MVGVRVRLRWSKHHYFITRSFTKYSVFDGMFTLHKNNESNYNLYHLHTYRYRLTGVDEVSSTHRPPNLLSVVVPITVMSVIYGQTLHG